MKTPGPDHPMEIAGCRSRMRVRVRGHVIADTHDAAILREAGEPPAVYFPREDVETGFLSETKATEHPYMGRATHYAMSIDGEVFEDVAISYEAPFPAAEGLRGLITFDPTQVEVYALPEDAPRHVQR